MAQETKADRKRAEAISKGMDRLRTFFPKIKGFQKNCEKCMAALFQLEKSAPRTVELAISILDQYHVGIYRGVLQYRKPNEGALEIPDDILKNSEVDTISAIQDLEKRSTQE